MDRYLKQLHDQIDGQVDRQRGRRIDRYTVMWTGIFTLHDQIDGQINRQTDRCTVTWTGIHSNCMVK